MPNHVGDGLHTIGISGPSRVRTELLRLAVVTALTPISAGLLLRHQPDVAGQLLAAVEAFGSSDSLALPKSTRAWEPTLFMESSRSLTLRLSPSGIY